MKNGNDWLNEHRKQELRDEYFTGMVEESKKPVSPLAKKVSGVIAALLIGSILLFFISILLWASVSILRATF